MYHYDAEIECRSIGGHLANIYSQAHMDDVMKYIREIQLRYIERFHLGMKYDPRAEKLTLRNGTDASADLKWLPGFPLTVATRGEGFTDRTYVLLSVYKDLSSIDPNSSNKIIFNKTNLIKEQYPTTPIECMLTFFANLSESELFDYSNERLIDWTTNYEEDFRNCRVK